MFALTMAVLVLCVVLAVDLVVRYVATVQTEKRIFEFTNRMEHTITRIWSHEELTYRKLQESFTKIDQHHKGLLESIQALHDDVKKDADVNLDTLTGTANVIDVLAALAPKKKTKKAKKTR